ncbi:hypothetical protein ACH5RR_022427 [Cinchona calisaya]|uniref:Uncharacterized protein n=1 Tax=Cinchona calisaya TaxID=153742 RepID=A0ABD2Z7S4_9GENT
MELNIGKYPWRCACDLLAFFAEQQTNCRYSCVEWEMGMEIDNYVKRDEVEMLVRELMDGEKGQKMRNKALDWKNKAAEAAGPNGSSYQNLDKLFKEFLLSKSSQ